MNRFPPPPRIFFSELSARGDADLLELDLGGFLFRLEGLDRPLHETIEARYRIYRRPAGNTGGFRIRILGGQADHFVPPGGPGLPEPHPLSLAWEKDILGIRSYGFVGWASFTDCVGEIALARSEYEKGEWCIENYLRVCIAWLAVREGGALLHGASIIRDGGAYVFIGASGSGKSTLAAISEEGRVVSDDLTLVRHFESGFQVAGTPFRGTYREGEAVAGFFPVAGLFRILKSPTNRLEPCPRKKAAAILLASCPFVVDQMARVPGLLPNLQALDEAHPLAYLHFSLDGRFWEVLPGR